MIERSGHAEATRGNWNRELDQHGTDRSIACDLYDCIIARDGVLASHAAIDVLGLWLHPLMNDEYRRLNHPLKSLRGGIIGPDGLCIEWIHRDQRGGIHSDPMVRVLAYRAWGDRDVFWNVTSEMAKKFDLDNASIEVRRATGQVFFRGNRMSVHGENEAPIKRMTSRGAARFVYSMFLDIANSITNMHGSRTFRARGRSPMLGMRRMPRRIELQWAGYVNDAMRLGR